MSSNLSARRFLPLVQAFSFAADRTAWKDQTTINRKKTNYDWRFRRFIGIKSLSCDSSDRCSPGGPEFRKHRHCPASRQPFQRSKRFDGFPAIGAEHVERFSDILHSTVRQQYQGKRQLSKSDQRPSIRELVRRATSLFQPPNGSGKFVQYPPQRRPSSPSHE